MCDDTVIGGNQLDDFYCPVPSREYMRKWLREERYRIDDDGSLEKLCKDCREYWPADTEFFIPWANSNSGLFYVCRACYADRYWQRLLARRSRKKTPLRSLLSGACP